MGFAEEYLIDDEELILDLKPHWWVFSIPAFILGGVIIVLILFRNISVLSELLALTVVGLLGWIGWVYLSWTNTHFVVTSRRVIYRSGVISKSGIEIPLERVNNVLFHQRVFERMLGAGDLTIESAGESGQQKFSNVRHPDAVQNEINLAMSAANKPTVHHTENTTDSIPVQIEKLSELLESGAISQAEYESSKADLLKKLN